jgi:hypothetical protein
MDLNFQPYLGWSEYSVVSGALPGVRVMLRAR